MTGQQSSFPMAPSGGFSMVRDTEQMDLLWYTPMDAGSGIGTERDCLNRNTMNELDQSSEVLAELLTLTVKEDEWGATTYRNHLGQFHRVHGPSVIFSSGVQMWFQNDQRHRTDGPSITYPNGAKEWYWYGEELSEQEYNERIGPIK